MTDAALGAIPDLPVMEELDALPTLDELRKAIDCLACGKSPGADGIPAEVLKAGKPALYSNLSTHSYASGGSLGYFPQDMPTSSPCIRTRETEATVTIAASPCSALLAKHLPEQYYAVPRVPCLPRIPVWLQSWKIHSGHDLLAASTTREVL